eukprot:TRINITY_DN14548_c1_g1_i1.p2 TRINITY_DN14548_c1_g1~~TRINITY_DN14548_c1_g1_i1.p2  ORF type:complete len:581 (+),score=116.88 TRINITY_DN14548_c1_g1_i1:91-1833(+)
MVLLNPDDSQYFVHCRFCSQCGSPLILADWPCVNVMEGEEVCLCCGGRGHVGRSCPSRLLCMQCVKADRGPNCGLCGGRAHSAEECPSKFCPSCGARGHDPLQCPQVRCGGAPELYTLIVGHPSEPLGMVARRDAAVGGPLYVASVQPDSAAARAGLPIGANVVAVNGLAVRSEEALLSVVQAWKAAGGRSLTVAAWPPPGRGSLSMAVAWQQQQQQQQQQGPAWPPVLQGSAHTSPAPAAGRGRGRGAGGRLKTWTDLAPPDAAHPPQPHGSGRGARMPPAAGGADGPSAPPRPQFPSRRRSVAPTAPGSAASLPVSSLRARGAGSARPSRHASLAAGTPRAHDPAGSARPSVHGSLHGSLRGGRHSAHGSLLAPPASSPRRASTHSRRPSGVPFPRQPSAAPAPRRPSAAGYLSVGPAARRASSASAAGPPPPKAERDAHLDDAIDRAFRFGSAGESESGYEDDAKTESTWEGAIVISEEADGTRKEHRFEEDETVADVLRVLGSGIVIPLDDVPDDLDDADAYALGEDEELGPCDFLFIAGDWDDDTGDYSQPSRSPASSLRAPQAAAGRGRRMSRS